MFGHCKIFNFSLYRKISRWNNDISVRSSKEVESSFSFFPVAYVSDTSFDDKNIQIDTIYPSAKGRRGYVCKFSETWSIAGKMKEPPYENENKNQVLETRSMRIF